MLLYCRERIVIVTERTRFIGKATALLRTRVLSGMIGLSLLYMGSCSTKNTEDLPDVSYSENTPSVYEGRVPIGEERFLYLEVTLIPGQVGGEGQYVLNETVEEKTGVSAFPERHGLYSTLYGYGKEKRDVLIQLHNSSVPDGIRRIYTNPGERVVKHGFFQITDLVLQAQGESKMVVLDSDSKPLTEDPLYNLDKRASRVFTLEGYLTHRGDTADFFEMNTGERMMVSKTGAYDEAIRQYHVLRKEKYEGIYLKAVGYRVTIRDSRGKQREALVLKKLIQMTSAPMTE
jgi:hypothetical protein